MSEILDNLNFFSKITQDTLSAFHFTGIDSEIYKNIEELKRAVISKKTRVLKTMTYNPETNTYKRIFTDDYEDEVSERDINSLSFLPMNETLLEKLNKNPSPISSIRLNNISTSEPKPISNILEQLFLE